MAKRLTTLEKAIRIIQRVKFTIDPNTGCYIPNIYINNRNKYGKCQLENVQTSLHRMVAYVYHGLDLRSELVALHKLECPYKCCFNQAHIYVGTQAQNIRDYLSLGKGRFANNQCPKGHIYDTVVRRSNGYKQRVCSICARESKRKCDIKNKTTDDG